MKSKPKSIFLKKKKKSFFGTTKKCIWLGIYEALRVFANISLINVYFSQPLLIEHM
jgi:hypothetical protein